MMPRSRRPFAPALVGLALALLPLHAGAGLPHAAGDQGPVVTPSLFSELHWRGIGPFRGGRTKAATGVPGRPGLFYIGVVNGGVWKTTDYGRTWQPIFDDQPTGSIGALAVAPSNPDVIYAGSGEGMQRPDLSTGDGIYRSSDGGRTWRHLGLRDGQQVAQIVVDPRDPNRFFVAVLGHPYGPERGARGLPVHRRRARRSARCSTATPTPAPRTSRSIPSNPDVVYAVLWESRQAPWENGVWTGPGSGLYKSTDGGTTWRPLTGGLPDVRRAASAASGSRSPPSESQRLYATVEATGERPGIYRSDDGGESWRRVNADPRVVARPVDAAEVRVHPKNPDVVLVPTIVTWKSTDGGKTFAALARRARRRRLPARLDRPRRGPTSMLLVGRPGRGRHRERRRDVEQLVQPADRAVFHVSDRRRVPVPRLRRTAGERLGVRAEPRRTTAASRSATGDPVGGRGVRIRRARPARPRRRLRRQGEPLRPPDAARPRTSRPTRCADPATACCARSQSCSRRSTRTSSTSPRTRSGRRRTAAAPGSRSAPTSRARAGRCRRASAKYRDTKEAPPDAARRRVRARAVAARR